MIDKIPHYKALYKVLYWTELVDSNISNKYKLIKQFRKRLIEEKGYSRFFDNDKLRALAGAVAGAGQGFANEYTDIGWTNNGKGLSIVEKAPSKGGFGSFGGSGGFSFGG